MKSFRTVNWLLVCILCVTAITSTPAKAQSPLDKLPKITPSAADQQAALEANVIYRHSRPANTPAAKALQIEDVRSSTPSINSASPDTSGLRFPGDLSFFGGHVVPSAQFHAVYLVPGNGNCPSVAACWGNPEGFLSDLGNSNFIHLVDQYTGMTMSNRYTVGKNAAILYLQTASIFTDANIQAFVHAVASVYGTGYGHIYHVFLPPGQDECFSANSHACYSPDDPRTFAFCGYHSSVQFTDIGHVLYSVEPFQDVPGCSVKPGTPNGQLVDSTNNTLSHESIETITDPDGSAWFNFTLVVLRGAEIGDECSFFTLTRAGAFFDPSVFTLNGNSYAVQPEYSNSAHACAVGP
jgi:hypothetical protein